MISLKTLKLRKGRGGWPTAPLGLTLDNKVILKSTTDYWKAYPNERSDIAVEIEEVRKSILKMAPVVMMEKG